MRIEIINTGTELLLGSVTNTHGMWLGKALLSLGLRVDQQTTVPDGEAIYEALKESVARHSDVVIVTGGLGPTSDDLTRELSARLFQRKLVQNEKALASLTEYFNKRSLVMVEDNVRQTYVPEGAECLENLNGTAPGIFYPKTEKNPAVFLLPGPPSELYPMFEACVKPRLLQFMRTESLMIPVVKIFDTAEIGESMVHHLVDVALNKIAGLEVGYCCHPGEVEVRLIGSSKAVDQGTTIVRDQLARWIVNETGESLEQTLVKELLARRWTIATAESCTGGLIAGRLTNASGASQVFRFGWVTYANEAKVQELNVPQGVIDDNGVVSEFVVRAMAEGALKKSGAKMAVSVSGIAGPTGGTEENPVGTVWVAWAIEGKETLTRRFYFPSSREKFRRRVVQAVLAEALVLVREY